MTREERDKAIRILQWLHDNYFLFRSTEEDVKYATKLAIQELQKESCEDTISRQAAIRLAEQGQVQGFEWQLKKLVELPPVTPAKKVGRWIEDEFGSKCSCYGIHTHLDKFDRPMKFKYCSMCGARIAESEEEGEENGQ